MTQQWQAATASQAQAAHSGTHTHASSSTPPVRCHPLSSEAHTSVLVLVESYLFGSSFLFFSYPKVTLEILMCEKDPSSVQPVQTALIVKLPPAGAGLRNAFHVV